MKVEHLNLLRDANNTLKGITFRARSVLERLSRREQRLATEGEKDELHKTGIGIPAQLVEAAEAGIKVRIFSERDQGRGGEGKTE